MTTFVPNFTAVVVSRRGNIDVGGTIERILLGGVVVHLKGHRLAEGERWQVQLGEFPLIGGLTDRDAALNLALDLVYPMQQAGLLAIERLTKRAAEGV